MKWVNAVERLPAQNQEYWNAFYIVCIGGKRVTVRIYEVTKIRGKTVRRWKYPWDAISDENITHWAELPEPPKEAANNGD